jgi:hypothetical protein
MPETLLSESTVFLFGRVIGDLEIVPEPHEGATGAIAALLRDEDAEIARIFSFAYQNEFFDLASPALFVVRGEGTPVDGSVETTGLSMVDGTLTAGLNYWAVDRDDVTVRLDVMTGAVARILLDYELAEEGLQDFVRGGSELGLPSNLSGNRRPRRGRRWRSDED